MMKFEYIRFYEKNGWFICSTKDENKLIGLITLARTFIKLTEEQITKSQRLELKLLQEMKMDDKETEQDIIKLIISKVCKKFNLTEIEIKQKTRKRHFCLPRQIAIYMIKKNTDLSFKSIGHIFNDKNQGAVSHALKKIAGWLEVDKDFKLLFDELC